MLKIFLMLSASLLTLSGFCQLTTTNYFQGEINSNVRNRMVISNSSRPGFPDSTIIQETGTYLVMLNLSGRNTGTGNILSKIYDDRGTVDICKKSALGNFVRISDYYSVDFFYPYRYPIYGVDPVIYNYYIPATNARSFIYRFQAGEVLKVGAKVISSGTPTTSWYVFFTVDLIKINNNY